MKSTAFIFSQSPYKKNTIKEGLDVVLAISLITEKTGIFFIGDGIFLVIKNQQSKSSFLFDHFNRFNMLLMYDMNKFYSCHDVLKNRGLSINHSFLVNLIFLDKLSFIKKINSFDVVLKF